MKYTDLIIGEWYEFTANGCYNISQYTSESNARYFIGPWIYQKNKRIFQGTWSSSRITDIKKANMEDVYQFFPELCKNIEYEIY